MLKQLSGALIITSMLLLPGVAGIAQAGEVNAIKRVDGITVTQGMPAAMSVQGSISREKALEIFRDTFPELTQGKDFEGDYNDNDGQLIWSFEWRESELGPGPTPQISGAVNAETGQIIDFRYQPDPSHQQLKGNVLTRDKAFDVAEKFLHQMHPDKVAMLKFSDRETVYYPRADLNMVYHFNWSRAVDGVAVDWDGISIGVDAVNGIITNYSYRWHDTDLPKVEKVVSREELTNKLINELGMHPGYTIPPDAQYEGLTAPVIPVYKLNTNVSAFDAETGQLLDYEGSEVTVDEGRMYTENFELGKNDSVIEEVSPTRQKVGPEIAQKAAEDFFKFLGMSGNVRKSGGGSSSGPGFYDEHWTYMLEQEKDYQAGGIQVDVDVYNGKVSGFHRWDPPYSEETKRGKGITYEQAQDKAKEMLKKINPEKFDLVVLRNEISNTRESGNYYFNFVRLVNGIPFDRDGIRVEIDQLTGEIIHYSIDWHFAAFAPVNDLISLEQAIEKFKKEQPLELGYIFPRNEKYESNGEPVLVYRFSESAMVDAITGEMIDYQQNKKDNLVQKSLFTGHWGEPALSLLNENGLLPEKSINPDGIVSRREALKVLTAAAETNVYYGNEKEIKLNFKDIEENDPDSEVIRQAVKKKIIANEGNFGPDQPLSREDLAVWLVDSLGYQKVAEIEYKISNPFKDAGKISADKHNYVGLAAGLGLLHADENGNFRPQASVTWAEISTAAIRVAPELQMNYKY